MRTINKGTEPSSLTDWKRRNPHSSYQELTEDIRRDIREHALKEQFYLCAYCCQRIKDVDACHNEHVEAQHLNNKRTLDFSKFSNCSLMRSLSVKLSIIKHYQRKIKSVFKLLI